MEYYDPEPRIKKAEESESQPNEAADIARGSSGLPRPRPAALLIEGREIGRKVKRAVEANVADEYLPPKERMRLTQLRSPSPLVDTPRPFLIPVAAEAGPRESCAGWAGRRCHRP